MNALRMERCILAHRLRGVTPWSVGSISFRPIEKQSNVKRGHGRESCPVYGSQEEKGETPREKQEAPRAKVCPPKACRLWPTFSSQALPFTVPRPPDIRALLMASSLGILLQIHFELCSTKPLSVS